MELFDDTRSRFWTLFVIVIVSKQQIQKNGGNIIVSGGATWWSGKLKVIIEFTNKTILLRHLPTITRDLITKSIVLATASANWTIGREILADRTGSSQ